MSHDIAVTFLGTTSGGGPIETRNCSSLVLDPSADGSLWMVDCAEGTVRQFALQPFYGAARVKLNRVNKIFITHMHADHTMGLVTLLRSVLGIPPPDHVPSTTSTNASPQVEIYGPSGLRLFLRTILGLTHHHSTSNYAVHELLHSSESASASCEDGLLHPNESRGRDIPCDVDGLWRGFLEDGRGWRKIIVDAGPIQHRDPCIGYVFNETFSEQDPLLMQRYIPRTIVILGDTFDPSGVIPLIRPPSSSNAAAKRVSLLIHEATDSHIPSSVDPEQRVGRNRTAANVLTKTRSRGHSTPSMAGSFAKVIGAERLVLNHLGARFPAPPSHAARSPQERFRLACMDEIERQATEAWGPPRGRRAQAAWDFMRVVVPPEPRPYLPDDTDKMNVGNENKTRAVVIDTRIETTIEVTRERSAHPRGSNDERKRYRSHRQHDQGNAHDGGRGGRGGPSSNGSRDRAEGHKKPRR